VNDSRRPESLPACRAEARRLLRQLRSEDPRLARAAAERFVRLRSLAPGGVEGLLARRGDVRLKHALAVLAEERGYPSWSELRRACAAPARQIPDLPSFHTPRLDALLNRWFRDHAEARASLEAEGGYLLPFGEHFFITESEGIRELGLDPDDPDWAALGFDLARPRDAAAHARLCARRRATLASGGG
jgi:hypothetical protein